ncbi:hypothetical protein ACYZX9_11250 [Sphingomonas citri]
MEVAMQAPAHETGSIFLTGSAGERSQSAMAEGDPEIGAACAIASHIGPIRTSSITASRVSANARRRRLKLMLAT